MLTYQFDDYNGVIIEKQELPNSKTLFKTQFDEMLLLVTTKNKKLIWFTLSIKQASFIKIATDLGFVFHNCLEDEITLILRLKEALLQRSIILQFQFSSQVRYH